MLVSLVGYNFIIILEVGVVGDVFVRKVKLCGYVGYFGFFLGIFFYFILD